MSTVLEPWIRVECSDCGYSANLCRDDDRQPPEVILSHGRETGHKLRVIVLDD